MFICEDNGLAIHAPIEKRQSYAISSAASQFGVKVFESASTDAYEIFQISKNARQYALDNCLRGVFAPEIPSLSRTCGY